MAASWRIGRQVLVQLLLFLLFAGLAALVDFSVLKAKFLESKGRRGLLVGVACQFLLMPVVGLLCVTAFGFDAVEGSMLLVVASSPGGAFSNLWCSLFNADLALSIACTTASTVVSLGMLPLNSYLYITLAYGQKVPLDFAALLYSALVVFAGVAAGTIVALRLPSWRRRLNLLGTVSGLGCIVISAVTSESGQESDPLWGRRAAFYGACLTQSVCGLLGGLLSASCAGLGRQQRVAVAVEVQYQNVGIASAAALSMFDDDRDVARAIGVPLFYGLLTPFVLAFFLLYAWRAGWTYAPRGDPLCQVLVASYQPSEDEGVAVAGEGFSSNAAISIDDEDAAASAGLELLAPSATPAPAIGEPRPCART